MFTNLPLSDGRDNLLRRSASKIDECKAKCFRYFELNFVIQEVTSTILDILIILQAMFESSQSRFNLISLISFLKDSLLL